MSNQHFTFKQFIIHNAGSSLKVGTDGVLLGAWTEIPQQCRALDIGTGTGLIALMMAQKGAAMVDAIDITAEAVENACLNVEQNKHFSNISIYHTSLQNFTSSSKYDVISCNPPWFINSLKSDNANKNTARHDDSLPANELFESVVRLLSPQGSFFTIIPTELERHYTLNANRVGLTLQRRLYIKTKANKPTKRVLLHYCFDAVSCQTATLCIEFELERSYTDEYKSLTRDFYLKF